MIIGCLSFLVCETKVRDSCVWIIIMNSKSFEVKGSCQSLNMGVKHLTAKSWS